MLVIGGMIPTAETKLVLLKPLLGKFVHQKLHVKWSGIEVERIV
jgi:hypothetical protein